MKNTISVLTRITFPPPHPIDGGVFPPPHPTPAVEQAATEVLSHKYSNQKRPTNRVILAKIKGT